MRKTFLIIFLILIFAQPLCGQTFEVKSVREDLKEVVIRDKQTGEEKLLKKGEEVGGWRVVEITADHVTISKPEGNTVYVTQIPIKAQRPTPTPK